MYRKLQSSSGIVSCLLTISIWTASGRGAKTDIALRRVGRRVSTLRLAFAGKRRKFHKIDCDRRAGKPHLVCECVQHVCSMLQRLETLRDVIFARMYEKNILFVVYTLFRISLYFEIIFE